MMRGMKRYTVNSVFGILGALLLGALLLLCLSWWVFHQLIKEGLALP
jgi:hypothetical protein